MDAVATLFVLARENAGVFTRTQARAACVSEQRLTDLVRRGVIARVARGTYVIGAMPPLLDPRALTVGCKGVLSHESAAAWLGGDVPAALDETHLTAPRNRGRRADAMVGIRLHRADLAGHEVVVWRGVRVTSPLRTALDVARRQPLESAVAIVDSLLRARLLHQDELDVAVSSLSGRGCGQARQVAALADRRSGSVLESFTRVLMWRHAIPVPISQYPFVHPSQGLVGYFDFGWERQRAILECDGFEFHAAREPFQKDRRRWSAISSLGWRLGVVTWHDVVRDPEYVVDLVRDLLAASGGSAHKP